MRADGHHLVQLTGPKTNLNMDSAVVTVIASRGPRFAAREPRHLLPGGVRLTGSILCGPDLMATEDFDHLMREATRLGASGALARKQGEEAAAEVCFREGFELTRKAASRAAECTPQPALLEILRAAILLALDCGEAAEARRLADEAFNLDPSSGTGMNGRASSISPRGQTSG